MDKNNSVVINMFNKNKHMRWRLCNKILVKKFNSLFAIPKFISESLCDGKLTRKVEYSHNTEVSNFSYVRRFIKIGKKYKRYYKRRGK